MNSRKIILYPIVLASYPILNLYCENLDEIGFPLIMRALTYTIIFSILLFVISSLLFRDTSKGALMSTVIVFIFFSFGHFVSYTPKSVFGIHIESSTVILLFAFLVIVSVALFLVLSKSIPSDITKYGNTLSVCLMLIVHVNIYSKLSSTNTNWKSEITEEDMELFAELDATTEKNTTPDVYYIVVDGRARSETLLRYFDYDDSETISQLKEMGFIIADTSTSNYVQTLLSISSTLNMRYHNGLANAVGIESDYRFPLKAMLGNSVVRRFFEDLGYDVYLLSGVFIQLHEEDPQTVDAGRDKEAESFELMLLNTTIMSSFFSSEKISTDYRNKVLDRIERTKNISYEDKPTFTYLHLSPPHPPFVFSDEGDPLKIDLHLAYGGDGDHYPGARDEYQLGYHNQVKYMDKQIMSLVQFLIENSETPPVIIVQSDHGSGYNLHWESINDTDLNERLEITNWYYLPGLEESEVPLDITPVNTFRLILKHYFNQDLEYLENINYFSTWSKPYKFIDVTNILKQGYLPNY